MPLTPASVRDRRVSLLIFLAATLLFFAGTEIHAQTQTAAVRVISPKTGGDLPFGAMQASDGNLYTVTNPGIGLTCTDNRNNTCTYLSRVTPDGTYSTFHAFEENGSTLSNTDGAFPNLIIEASDGNFYGTAKSGGANNFGTVFKIAPDGTFTLLYTFPIDAQNNAPSGSEPGRLIAGVDGNFYGMTMTGGVVPPGSPSTTYAKGTFFKISPAGVFTLIHTFLNTDGVTNYFSSYSAGLVQGVDGNFYSVGQAPLDPNSTSDDAPPNAIYQITPSGTIQVLHQFAADGSEGSSITSALTVGPDGNFYGTSGSTLPVSGNGTFGNRVGNVFRVSSTGAFRVLFTFSAGGGMGLQTDPNLTLGSDGNLYGTATVGGDPTHCPYSSGCGTIFQIQPSGNFNDLHNFVDSNTDGGFPGGSLVQLQDGSFAGATRGGVLGGGTSVANLFNLSLSPVPPAPVQLTFSPATVGPQSSTTLTWKVLNAFSATAQQCHASILGVPPGADEAHWFGPQTGALSGLVYTGSATITPTATGTFTYVLNCGGVETGTATLVVGNPVQILTTSLPDATVSKPYNLGLSATGGATPYTWGYSGAFPAGLVVDSTTGVVTGTPKQFGVYQVTFGVQDSSAPPQITTTTLKLTIDSGLSLIGSLNNGVVGTAYNVTATATGGLGPYKWSLTSGKLPDGLTLNTTTGVISGTPNVADNYAFVLSVSDSEGTPATATQSYTISTAVPPLAIEASHFDCTVQISCAGSFNATGGTPPYTWVTIPDPSGAIFDNFPSGLTLSSNGSFAGKPLQATQTTPTIQVTDSATPAVTVTGHGSFNIDSGLQIVSITLPPATIGMAYQAPPPVATGGLTPYKWVVSGSAYSQISSEYFVPAATGVLTSPGPVTPGTFTLHYTAYDAEGVPSYVEADATLIVSLPTITSVTTLSSSGSSAGTGMTITLTANVSTTSGTPTGTVTFYNGSSVLGTATLNTTGIATLPTSFSATGIYSLTASYSGGGDITGSVSAPLVETIVTPTVSASSTPGTLTIKSGNSGTLTLTLTPTGGYTGTVALSCGTLPAHVSCSFEPAVLTISYGSTSPTSVLTVSTGPGNVALLTSPKGGHNGTDPLLAIEVCSSIFGLSLLGVSRRRKYLATLFGACWLVYLAGGLIGCSSSSSAVTTPGTYSIPIVLKLGDGTTIAANTTLVVQ
jgi:uncharacterized repeat protein (TIGR03803 family)